MLNSCQAMDLREKLYSEQTPDKNLARRGICVLKLLGALYRALFSALFSALFNERIGGR